MKGMRPNRIGSRVSFAGSDDSHVSSELGPQGYVKKNRDDEYFTSEPDTSATNPESGPRKSVFGARRSLRQSIGGYTSLFARKLLPPLGFYREVDKYTEMKAKFQDEPEKLEALDEMWQDYKKYQIRKRFRWPPHIFCKRFFWTTGYYADYQKTHRATTLRKPGEDSSEEEFIDPTGQFFVAGQDGDINVEEFARYRQAKMADPNRDKRMTRWDIKPIGMGAGAGGEGMENDDGDGETPKQKRKSRKERRSDASSAMGTKKETELIETVVEYQLIPNPKKKSMAGKGKGKKKTMTPDEIEAALKGEGDGEAPKEPPPVIGKKKSVVVRTTTTDKATGEKVERVQQHEQVDMPDNISEVSSVKPKKKGKKKKEAAPASGAAADDNVSDAGSVSVVSSKKKGTKKKKAPPSEISDVPFI